MNSIQNAAVSAAPTARPNDLRRPTSSRTPCSDDQRLVLHAAAVADLLDVGVQRQIDVVVLERALQERLDLVVERGRRCG
jgi:hypothetical protein